MNAVETQCRRATRLYTFALVAIGIIDLGTTVIWLRTGQATEANPVMYALLQLGIIPFIGAKLATLFGYAAAMEYYSQRCAPRARGFSFVTLALYIMIYVVSFCGINHRLFVG